MTAQYRACAAIRQSLTERMTTGSSVLLTRDSCPTCIGAGVTHTDLALTAGVYQWDSRGLIPGPTDYECDRNPHGTLTIRRFVLGCLTLADPADQGLSLMCAIYAP